MRRIVCIVEGHGEYQAVPLLLRRLVSELAPGAVVEVTRPIRQGRQKLLKEGELERAVELAARQSGSDGGILILVDADEDCPADLGPRILARARAARSDRAIHVVLAKSEYEAWFLAAATSIAGERNLRLDLEPPEDPEAIRDAKGWLSRHMSARSYSETLDQPALTQLFDLQAARAAPSFDKLCRVVGDMLASPGTPDAGSG